MSAARLFALLVGIFFLAFGILGFIPGLVTPAVAAPGTMTIRSLYGALLGFLPTNVLHDIVYCIIGICGILASFHAAQAMLFSRMLVWVMLAMGILGLLPGASRLWGLMPLWGWNELVCLAAGLLAFYFGFILPVDRREPVHGNI
jgi:hypothetical protein